MREIELKFKVENLANILNILEKNNCEISEVIIQNDSIFVLNLNDIESKEGSVWLRIRKTNDITELNYKKQSAKKMESQEIEFEVSSYEKANDFLEALGYKKWVEVHKKRRYSKYNDVNVCIDEVERLGCFIELELLIDEEDNINYEEVLLNIANELNIDVTNRVDSHYDTMISELNN